MDHILDFLAILQMYVHIMVSSLHTAIPEI